MFRKFLVIAFIFLLVMGCGPERGVPDGRAVRSKSAPKRTSLISPAQSLSIPIGKDIPVRLEYPDSVKVDSVQLYLGGTLIQGSVDLEHPYRLLFIPANEDENEILKEDGGFDLNKITEIEIIDIKDTHDKKTKRR